MTKKFPKLHFMFLLGHTAYRRESWDGVGAGKMLLLILQIRLPAAVFRESPGSAGSPAGTTLITPFDQVC